MSQVNQTLYLPYGAYELKATYQRNLGVALLSTITLVMTLLAVAWAFSGDHPQVVPVDPQGGKAKVEIRKDWPKPPTIKRSRSSVGPVAQPENVIISGRLNPVDEEFFDEPVVMATRNERAVIVAGGDGLPGTGEGSLDQDYGGSLDGVEYLPPIDSFVRVEEEPELIYRVKPEYPRFSRMLGDEGTVIIKALVGKKGDVLEAVVFGSSGHVLLDEAALAVAGLYKYRPAIQNRRPIAVWVTYNVEFKLD